MKQAAGRWSLFRALDSDPQTGAQAVTRREAEIESACRMLLARYGVVFRDLLERETTVPRWRELLQFLRRMEARGEVRGGRFVSGFGGEQFALPAALESLREARRAGIKLESVTVAAADPLNLIGVVIPGERIAAVAGNRVTFDEAVLRPLDVPRLSGQLQTERPIAASLFVPPTDRNDPSTTSHIRT